MQKDRFGKTMLVVIAALLAANLFRSKAELVLPLESSAQAQNVVSSNPGNSASPPKKLLVRNIQGFSVADVKEVVSLGDGKTFVVSNPNGFMVYTLEPQM
jgi:hypothetical protein